MSSIPSNSSWFREEQAILAVTLASIALAFVVVRPYLQYVLFGITLAYIVWPLQQRLSNYLRRDLSALALTVGTILLIPLPFIFIIRRLTQEVFAVISTIEQTQIGAAEIEAELLEFGIELDVEELYQTNQETIADGLDTIASTLVGTVQSLPQILIGLTISIFVLFVLLRDGERLLEWVSAISPVREEFHDEFATRLDKLMWASIIGNIAASMIQAVALGVALFLLGFENTLFLMMLTFVAALLPLVGAFLVWVPLVGYLVATGSIGTAILLFVFGTVVSVSDFYTRPVVIGQSGELNVAIIVVGVFGGLVALGPVGLLIGPVVLGGTKVAIEALVAARDSDLTPTKS